MGGRAPLPPPSAGEGACGAGGRGERRIRRGRSPLPTLADARATLRRKGGRVLRTIVGAIAVTVSGACTALYLYVQTLPPLDLTQANLRSVVVLDRSDRLLRPFATVDGRWRLPVSAGTVDPRTLAMLRAYEDRRFASHSGVDPVGVARAAWQWLAHGRVVSGASTLSMQVARLVE
ncbi:transglycosylase domain-containing protein, partial [Methylobacterium trifolii]